MHFIKITPREQIHSMLAGVGERPTIALTDVCFWHIADMSFGLGDVCLQRNSGH
jgi:hypothetical protein